MNKELQARTTAQQSKTAELLPSSQPCTKPNVVRSFIQNATLRVMCAIFPKSVLKEAFHRGTIQQDFENMCNYGVLVHSKENKDKLLHSMSFEEWYSSVRWL